jgi:hypothetical protein
METDIPNSDIWCETCYAVEGATYYHASSNKRLCTKCFLRAGGVLREVPQVPPSPVGPPPKPPKLKPVRKVNRRSLEYRQRQMARRNGLTSKKQAVAY